MTNIFETKEEYFKLKNFWKTYHAEGRHKKIPRQDMRFDYTTKELVPACIHMESPLNVYAHVIYLAATGKDLDAAIGNMGDETYYKLWSLNVDYYRRLFFKIFEESIDEKYYLPISEKILSYLKEKRN